MARRESGTSDEGFTLVELLVYSLLSVTVLLIVGTIMISALNIEQTVRESTIGASTAQLAASSVEAGVRNGTAFKVTPIGDDVLLEARTAGSDPDSLTWHCSAWYFSEGAGTIRHTSTASDSLPIVAPTGEPEDWTLLSSGINPPDSGEVFTASGSSVTIEFTASTESSNPVVVKSVSSPRAGVWESAACFD